MKKHIPFTLVALGILALLVIPSVVISNNQTKSSKDYGSYKTSEHMGENMPMKGMDKRMQKGMDMPMKGMNMGMKSCNCQTDKKDS